MAVTRKLVAAWWRGVDKYCPDRGGPGHQWGESLEAADTKSVSKVRENKKL